LVLAGVLMANGGDTSSTQHDLLNRHPRGCLSNEGTQKGALSDISRCD
jgi:hypothetical protein